MKGTKKLLIALLSVACMTAGAMGAAACKQGDESNSQIYAVYQAYVASAEESGSNVLSYEDWLETIKGEKGDTGAKGETGAKGDTGEKGETGADGKSAYEIAVENGFKGTEAEWLASLKGDKGDQGDKGEPGQNGSSTGTGEDGKDGKDGADGKSAYEIAVENGFEGTEEEWLASLKGNKGDQGEQGETGAQGSQGEQGEQGVGIKSVRTLFADKWNIAFYYEFTLTDGSKITTEDTPIIMVIPHKEYEAADETEYETLLNYGVEEHYIRFKSGAITGIHTNVQTFLTVKDVAEDEIQNILNDFISTTYIDIMYEQGVDSVSLRETECKYYIDITQAGLYYIDGSYEGFSFQIPVLIIDEEIPNEDKQVLYVGQDNKMEFSVGIPAEELLKNMQDMQVSVYYNNSVKQNWVSLSELELDLSEVDTSVAGIYQLDLTYEGFSFTVEFEIKDYGGNPDNPEEERVVGVLTGEDNKSVYAYKNTPVTAIVLYDNMTADLVFGSLAETFDSESDVEQYTIKVNYDFLPGESEGMPGGIIIASGGVTGAIFALDFSDMQTPDGEDGVLIANFADYTFTGEPIETFTGVNSQGQAFTIKTYNNGMSEMVFDSGETYNVGTVCDVEPDENDITWFNVVGIEYFNLQNGELNTITVDNQTTPEDGSSREEFLGQWNVFYAAEVYANGKIIVNNSWNSASLLFFDDGRVQCIECSNGTTYRDWATWSYNADTKTVTITLDSNNATVVIENGVMIYRISVQDSNNNTFTGTVKMRK